MKKALLLLFATICAAQTMSALTTKDGPGIWVQQGKKFLKK